MYGTLVGSSVHETGTPHRVPVDPWLRIFILTGKSDSGSPWVNPLRPKDMNIEIQTTQQLPNVPPVKVIPYVMSKVSWISTSTVDHPSKPEEDRHLSSVTPSVIRLSTVQQYSSVRMTMCCPHLLNSIL